MKAIEELCEGRAVLLVDDLDERQEGVLVLPADAATPARVAWMVRQTAGFLMVALPDTTCRRLRLPLIPPDPGSERPAFTVTVDARRDVGTGISAADRARTIRLLAAPHAGPADFTRPGHVMPLAAADDGVLSSPGRGEAALDLVRAAGRASAALLADLVDLDGGGCLAGSEAIAFAAAEGLAIATITDVVTHRCTERVQRVGVAAPAGGAFRAVGYRDAAGTGHVALVLGEPRGAVDLPVHVHRECPTGALFGAQMCGCRARLDAALAAVVRAGRGAVVYLRSRTAPLCCPAESPLPAAAESLVAAVLRDLAPASIRRIEERGRGAEQSA